MEYPLLVHPKGMKKQILLFLLPLSCLGQVQIQGYKFPFDPATLNYLSWKMNDTLMPVYRLGKYQYINSNTGLPVIDESFDLAYPFHRGYGIVKQNNRYGIINSKGNYVVKPDYAFFFIPDYPDIVVFNTQEWFSFEDAKMHTGFYGEEELAYPQTKQYKLKQKFGLIFLHRTTAPVYDSVIWISMYNVVVKKHGKIGIVDNSNRTMIPFIYDEFAGTNGTIALQQFALRKGKYWFYFDKFKILFKTPYKPALLASNLFIFEKNGLFNYFDPSGKPVLPAYYKWISSSRKMAINQKGEVVLFNSRNEEFVYFRSN